MENDLTTFEKNLLRAINALEGTNYNYKNLMEWSNSESKVKDNLREGELMYSTCGYFVAIKPTAK